MGKTRKKNHSEVEYLRGRNKELEKLVRSLQRQIKDLEKKLNYIPSIFEDNINEEHYEIKKIAKCPECNKGNLDLIINLSIKQIFECKICNYRKVVNL